MAKLGRPTLYKEEYPEMLLEHMAQGYSFESFGAIAKCCRDTLYEWVRVHPDFSYAKNHGALESQFWWEKLIRAGAMGEVDRYNAATAIFTMKCRFGWKDEQPVVVTKEDSKLVINLGGNNGTVPDKADSN
jgi:hypothetical protein